jgi:hypothetical protein
VLLVLVLLQLRAQPLPSRRHSDLPVLLPLLLFPLLQLLLRRVQLLQASRQSISVARGVSVRYPQSRHHAS